MVVVAGPSGSGKTTSFNIQGFGIDSFSVDDRCAQILGGYAHITQQVRRQAARACERFVNEHLMGRRSFAVETTLRTAISVEQAKLAGARGFLTIMTYVAAPTPEECVRRVLQRAKAGGHGASEEQVRAIIWTKSSSPAW